MRRRPDCSTHKCRSLLMGTQKLRQQLNMQFVYWKSGYCNQSELTSAEMANLWSPSISRYIFGVTLLHKPSFSRLFSTVWILVGICPHLLTLCPLLKKLIFTFLSGIKFYPIFLHCQDHALYIE